MRDVAVERRLLRVSEGRKGVKTAGSLDEKIITAKIITAVVSHGTR